MGFIDRLRYYRRISSAYLGKGTSQLTFWHETPEVNPNFDTHALGEYYMTFARKADYTALLDADGIPMLDYRGALGPQYNPIAIAQYGLGNYNQWKRVGEPGRRENFLRIADWLLAHRERNAAGLWMWMHHFDWEYRDTLRAPWYSALAQGQGISVLVRAYRETGDARYLDGAREACRSFCVDIGQGGVRFVDKSGDAWYEEYIVNPPTHILNGAIWAIWGLYDLALVTGESEVRLQFDAAARTIARNLPLFDLGFWSLYEQAGKALPMVASGFYHKLHITQLKIMHTLTGDAAFREYAERWQGFADSAWRRNLALGLKALFKLCYY